MVWSLDYTLLTQPTAKQSFLFSLSYTFRVPELAWVQILLSDGECQGLCGWPHRSDHTEFRLQYPNYTCSPVRWQTSKWAPAELASKAPSIVADMESIIESPQMRQAQLSSLSSKLLVKRKTKKLDVCENVHSNQTHLRFLSWFWLLMLRRRMIFL